MALDILFEDENYIFVNKASGMLTIPDRHNENLPSLVGMLRRKYEQVFIIHRLDRDTSGLICLAKDEHTHRYTSQLFEKRLVDKYYLGIVNGQMLEERGLIDAAIMEHPVMKGRMIVNKKQGKPSQTEFEVLETYSKYSLVKFKLLTGRTHQIRVHCKNIEHPLVCDELYGQMNPVYISNLKKKYNLSKTEEEEKPILNRLALHAYQLDFTTESGKSLSVEAPLPKDMSAMLKQCKKWLK